MNRLLIEVERDNRHPDDCIRHLEAEVDTLRNLVAELERKLGERVAVEEER